MSSHTHTHSYTVPGHKVLISQQPKISVCWAAAYTMMISWKNQRPYDIADAVGQVGATYRNVFELNIGLSTAAPISARRNWLERPSCQAGIAPAEDP